MTETTMTERIAAAFVPLVDSAVLIAAHECGFAREQGIALTLLREPSWASLRDHLNLGHVDCAHALAPLPVATALGAGHVQVDCVVPFVLSRGGNAITLSRPLADAMTEHLPGSEPLRDPRQTGAALAAAIRARKAPLSLAMVFPFSSHNYDLRYWLAAAGLHPDRDLRLVTIPPPLMVDSLRAGHIDGFCVGEPWNSLAVAQGLGRIVATKSQIFPHSPEKVLAVNPALAAESEPLDALLRALAAAAQWCDDPGHRAELAALLARPEYVGVDASLIAAALAGQPSPLATSDHGDPDFLYFHRHDANRPRREDALWCYAQMLRWGQVAGRDGDDHVTARVAARVAADRAADVVRPDLYERALNGTAAALPPPTAFDRRAVWPADVHTYLAQFALHTPFAEFVPSD
jgi:two-component system, oxyanion-binding sensor